MTIRTNKKLIAIGILVAMPLFGWVGVAQAHSFRTGDNTTVAVGETINNSLFISGRTIDIAGNVNGDVFCAGQNITITGYVSGDVICAGQSVRVSGKVDGDVRVAGQNVAIGGSIAHNVSAAGQTVVSEANSRIDGDASIGGQDVTLNGLVGRDLALGSGNTTINGKVGRNVQAAVDRLSLGDNATIAGDVQYTSQNTLNTAEGSKVVGKVTHNQPPAKSTKHSWNSSGSVWFILWFLASMLLLALALVLLMPQAFLKATDNARRHLGRTLLVGLAAGIATPVLIVTLMLTLVGIPLGLLLILLWLVALTLSGPYAAFLLGRYLLRGRNENAIWIMLLGGTVLILVYLVPVLGWIVALVASWFGMGMILTQLAQIRKATVAPITAKAVKKSHDA